MIMVMDIGNTNIVMGVYRENTLVTFWRIATVIEKSADEYGMLINQLFKFDNINTGEIKGVVISSVVPSIMYSIEHMIDKYFKIKSIVVGPGIKTGINIKYDNPKEVGADRIVNAVAAYKLYGGPIIIIDFGTATTFCVVSEKGEYMGGAIAPGIRISTDALFQKAAKLPKIELITPKTIICKNTISSMQAGVIFGFVGQVDYIVRKIQNELDQQEVKVVATGGMSRLIASESETIDETNAFLTLEGLKIIYDINKECFNEESLEN